MTEPVTLRALLEHLRDENMLVAPLVTPALSRVPADQLDRHVRAIHAHGSEPILFVTFLDGKMATIDLSQEVE